ALADKHPETAAFLDEILVDQFLVALHHRERVELVIRSDAAHRRQRIAVLQCSFENHGDHLVSQLPINRLVVIPVRIHGPDLQSCAGLRRLFRPGPYLATMTATSSAVSAM